MLGLQDFLAVAAVVVTIGLYVAGSALMAS
jgi:hypothetical protein